MAGGAYDEFNNLPRGGRGVPVCVTGRAIEPHLMLVKNSFLYKFENTLTPFLESFAE